MKKIASIVGARPQFIKCAPLSTEIRKYHNEILIHTGQHYNPEMSKLFFEELSIPKPDYNLEIGSGFHGYQTGRMLEGIEKVLIKEKPNLVLVYGDTNSTLAGSLAASKLNIPIAHVEAGLRSFDKEMPEEINRILTDHASSILFAPTKTAVANLKIEGIKENVHLVGDVMKDALLNNLKIAEKSRILEKYNVESGNYLLATIHRPSNTDNRENLRNIIEAFSESGEQIIFPIHPRTRKVMEKNEFKKRISNNIIITKPIGYIDFLCLQKNARIILTDSGGIQKESYMLNVPCITLRNNTEWIETIDNGWNILVDSKKKEIVDAINNFKPKCDKKNVFGDGKASEKIVKLINSFFV